MDYEMIDRALGRLGQPPQPLETGLSPTERDALLAEALCFPDRTVPTGELANWAMILIELGKEPAVMAAVAAIEAVLSETPSERADVEFVKRVLAELHIWLESPKSLNDLRRLGDLWWSGQETRHSPQIRHLETLLSWPGFSQDMTPRVGKIRPRIPSSFESGWREQPIM